MRKIIFSLLLTVSLFAFTMTAVLAHGGGGAEVVNPEDKNCMGQLASMHARDDGGIKNSSEVRPHPGFDGPHDNVKQMMKAFKAYCMGD